MLSLRVFGYPPNFTLISCLFHAREIQLSLKSQAYYKLAYIYICIYQHHTSLVGIHGLFEAEPATFSQAFPKQSHVAAVSHPSIKKHSQLFELPMVVPVRHRRNLQQNHMRSMNINTYTATALACNHWLRTSLPTAGLMDM